MGSMAGGSAKMLPGPAARGCPFVDRCAWRLEVCATDRPPLRPLEGSQQLACHLEEAP
jgi:ABC-type dipeptide/oligopeptide/nickel transport system ATPase component